MKRISIIPNIKKDEGLVATTKLIDILLSLGKEIWINEGLDLPDIKKVKKVKSEKLSKADLLVVLGGDGTILEIAQSVAKANTPVLGINLGHLGFLSQAEEFSKEMFEEIFAGNYSIRECMMLSAEVVEKGKVVGKFTALNDIVLKGELARMINISLNIDGTNTNNYPADGVIIATATGSTAYSLSAGGAIVHPELDAIIITPICPHTLKARCMIVPDSKTVQVSFSEPYRNDAVLNVDGERNLVLSESACVRVEKSKYKVKFINLNKRNFYDIIREKIADRII